MKMDRNPSVHPPFEVSAPSPAFSAVIDGKLLWRRDDFDSGVGVSLHLNFTLYSHTKHFGVTAMEPEYERMLKN